MTAYLARRCVLMLALMMVVFVIIQLPPGNYVSTDAERLQACGNPADQATLDALNRQDGFDRLRPVAIRFPEQIWYDLYTL